uniref:ZP domain-containing protein n=1 Tax=Pelodiscus sinensis TaxID=13735 RepID=K7GAA4_PELSI
SCPLGAPWSPREIVCEENYMEVSEGAWGMGRGRACVLTAVPSLRRRWCRRAQGALKQVWQVGMPATMAHSLGYGVNTTATRVLFRAPYGTTQSERATVEGLDVEMARATVFYKQAWMMLMVDTAIACPVTVVSATTLSWETPRILPSLVLWPERYRDERVQMGLDGRLIDAATITRNGYALLTDARLVRVVVPIGAPGGLMQPPAPCSSSQPAPRGGARSLLVQPLHLAGRGSEWGCPGRTDGNEADSVRGWGDVKTTNRSANNCRLPSELVGPHGPAMVLTALVCVDVCTVGNGVWCRGRALVRVSQPQWNKAFALRVPFADPLVQQQYLHGPLRRYTLHLNYTLRLVPTGQTFAQPGLVTCDVPDAVPPTFQGSCEPGALVLVMTRGSLDRFWVPYVGEQPLSQQAAPHSYQVSDDGHHFRLAVSLLAPGLAYESISLHWLAARLEFSLRDNKTLAVLASFSIVCTFPTGQLLVCLPNGTMVATVRSLDTRPALDPRRTHLRDPSCGPVASDSSQALFSFSLASCGTTRQFEGDSLVYENEVTFVPEG